MRRREGGRNVNKLSESLDDGAFKSCLQIFDIPPIKRRALDRFSVKTSHLSDPLLMSGTGQKRPCVTSELGS